MRRASTWPPRSMLKLKHHHALLAARFRRGWVALEALQMRDQPIAPRRRDRRPRALDLCRRSRLRSRRLYFLLDLLLFRLLHFLRDDRRRDLGRRRRLELVFRRLLDFGRLQLHHRFGRRGEVALLGIRCVVDRCQLDERDRVSGVKLLRRLKQQKARNQRRMRPQHDARRDAPALEIARDLRLRTM